MLRAANGQKAPGSALAMVLVVLAVLSLIAPDRALSSSDEAAYKYNNEGLELSKAGDYEGAIEAFKQARRYLPANDNVRKNLIIAYNNYGGYFINEGEFYRAIEQFEKAYYYDEAYPYTLYNLGQAYYLVQNMRKAEEYLERVYEIDPSIKGLKGLLEKVKKESGVEGGFSTNETLHFIMALSPGISIDASSYLRVNLEDAYGRVGMLLNHYPDKKTIVVLYSEKDYDSLLGGRAWWVLALYDGKMRIPTGKLKYTRDEVVRIIYHEYAHAVAHDIAGSGVPVWLQEGIATKAETFVTPKDKGELKRYLNSYGFIPLSRMPASFANIKDHNVVTLLYLESYLLVEYIILRGGYRGLHDILLELGKGEHIDMAIASVLGEDMPAFEKGWERYLRSEFGLNELKYIQ